MFSFWKPTTWPIKGDITGPEVHGGLGVTIAPQLKSSHPRRSVLLHIHPHNMPASIINIIISSYSFTSSSESLKVGILNPFFYYDLFYLLEVFGHSYLFPSWPHNHCSLTIINLIKIIIIIIWFDNVLNHNNDSSPGLIIIVVDNGIEVVQVIWTIFVGPWALAPYPLKLRVWIAEAPKSSARV